MREIRARSTPDIARIAEAMRRPGIDPRLTSSLAIVTSDPFVDDRDGKEGVFVDVTLVPSAIEETARLGMPYAGQGWGLYLPVAMDDEVLVVFPNGEFDHGGIIVANLYSSSSKPPSEAKDNPADVILHVQKDKNMRITLEGEGAVFLKTEKGDINVESSEGNVNVTADKGNIAVEATAGTMSLKCKGDLKVDSVSGNVVFDGGSTPVAKEGSKIEPHTHPFTGTAGPYAVSPTVTQPPVTDPAIASGQGSAKILVP